MATPHAAGPVATADQIADWFLWNFAHENPGRPCSPKKIQKLVYYAQAWHLALLDRPLFGDKIEAWLHGPVVPDLYHRFKGFGYSPIKVDPSMSKPAIDEESESVLSDVLDVYGGFDATYLEILTHRERPWQDVWQSREFDPSASQVIPHDAMATYYRELNERAERGQGVV